MPDWSAIRRSQAVTDNIGERGGLFCRAPHNLNKKMQTINCGLKLHENHTGVGVGITPAEVLVLTQIHSPGVDRGQYPVIVDAVLNDGEAVTIETPSVAAEEEQHLLGGKVIPAKEAVPAKTHTRTDAEEYDRLKAKYHQTVDGDPKKTVVSQLFNALNPSLPKTFGDIGLTVAETPLPKPVKTRGESTQGNGESAFHKRTTAVKVAD